MTEEQIKQYLKRLGLEKQPPTKDFLFQLHRAHVEKIPWESIDVFAGRSTSIYYNDSIHHILNNRSGYCFHLNGAFYMLLKLLGFHVTLHKAGVQRKGANPCIDSYHVGLVVSFQEDNLVAERFIVDVGLGDMPYEPIPLNRGIYEQGPFIYEVSKSSISTTGWRLIHDPRGAFTGVDYDPAVIDDIQIFKPNHEYLSTSPESVWVNLLLVRNRDINGSNELRGCIFSRTDEEGVKKTEITSKSMWFNTLADVFNEKLDDYSESEKGELWNKVLKKHEQWKQG